MSIKDVIKNSFIKNFSADISTTSIIIMLAVTAFIAVYLFFVYRMTCRKAFYSKSFAISLVVNAMVTAVIILTIQSSVVVSLGMVGALSIVRFRTAIKDPMDLAFLFWSISIGIICGAGLYKVAIIGSVIITIVMLLLHFIPNVSPTQLLILNIDDAEKENVIVDTIKENVKSFEVKSRNITSKGMDMIVEVKPVNDAVLVKAVSKSDGVLNATLMMHDGEITY